jgi:Leucine-rich repeat (LRR) protein
MKHTFYWLLALLLVACSSSDDPVLPPRDTTPPQIVTVTPTRDDTALDATITVLFSEAMDATSTSAAFSSSPAIDCAVVVTVDTLTCEPGEPLDFRETYTITISTAASDTAGNSLVEGRTFRFTTVAPDDSVPPTVVSTRPANNTQDVARNANISVTFSEAMDMNSATAAFSSDPDITCNFTFNAAEDTLICATTASLADNTRYTVTIGAEATDIAGNPLPAPFAFSFTTFSEVIIPPDNTTPTITTFTAAGNARTDEPVTFSWQVQDADEDALSCTLNPGDGTPPYQIADCQATTRQDHTYQTAGTFTATLTVRDDSGASDDTATATTSLEVTGENERPSLRFLNFDPPAEGAEAQVFTFFTEAEDDGEVVRYEWRFGDGNSITSEDPTATHTYTAAGMYLVTVTAVDNEDARATLSVSINVEDTQIGEPCSRPGNILTFPDTNLATAVREAINAQTGNTLDGDILCSDIASLLELIAPDSDIESLAGLEQAVSLQTLSLPENAISNVSPLAGLTQLERINLNGNAISDISPLAGLADLSSLFIATNDINDISPVAGLSNLTRLDIGNNNVESLNSLGALTGLRQLGIYNNGLENLAALAPLVNLTFLSASDNLISDVSPLAGLTDLRVLGLANNAIETANGLEGLTRLETLLINDNSLRNIAALASNTTLRQLDLANNDLINISVLSTLTGLDELDISGNSIYDLQPLIDNPAWTPGDDLNIVDNCLRLDLGNIDFINLNILIGQGVEVTFGAQRDCASITVSVTPVTSTVAPGTLVELSASLEGAPVSGITWEADGGELIVNGNLAAFSSPETPGTYTVTATATADSQASASATIIVTAPEEAPEETPEEAPGDTPTDEPDDAPTDDPADDPTGNPNDPPGQPNNPGNPNNP